MEAFIRFMVILLIMDVAALFGTVRKLAGKHEGNEDD